jgi:hypothetical protein
LLAMRADFEEKMKASAEEIRLLVEEKTAAEM